MFLITDAFKMVYDIYRNSWVIYLWGGLLNIPQVVGGAIFFNEIEGQVILAILILTLIVAGQMHKKTPFSTLIGLCHLPWLALLPWLVYRLQVVDHASSLEAWCYYVVVVITISLVFDVLDIYRYSKGQKTFSWRAQ